jgi:penicillin-binding protein 2
MKNYRVKSSIADIEPHEVFLDKLAKAKEEELGISEKKFEVPLKEKISYVLFGIFLFLAIALFSKTFYLQVFEGKELYIAAENNKGSINIIVPDRGIIYDKNLKKLVSNSPAFDLICERARFSSPSDEIIKEIDDIALAVGANPVDLTNKIQSSDSSEVLVAEDISHENLLVLETKINEFIGCKIQQNTVRDYLYGPVFSQVLGYTGRINKEEYSSSKGYAISGYIGKIGIEKYYESYLRGVPGQSKPAKKTIDGKAINEVVIEPQPGNNLILNIDAGLQQEVYNALEKSIKNIGAKRGAAVAIDPRTGAVLALVSYPSYDDNLFSQGISQEDYNKIESEEALFNRAIAGQYPTGSTIKPFEASAVLQEKTISPAKQINDIGYIEVRSKYDPSVVYRYEGVTPHGWVDMREAIAVSSNIYFYTVGGGYGDQQGLGPSRIKKYLELFGWGNKTGIDLPGEFEGFIPTPEWKQQNIKESWWDGDTYNLSIGQSYLKVTPLQVAVAYSAIANGGILYKPQIVNRIIGPLESSVQPVKSFVPEIIRQNFIDLENLQIVREGMNDCVYKSYGSCSSLKDLPVDIAAKTGTAETGRDGFYNTWASAFAPYDNPEIVFVATIESVQGLRAATLPVAHDVLQYYFSKK